MKIALVGSEPTSHGLAPWDDTSWEIWGSGLGSYKYPRIDRHYEIHALDLLERGFGGDQIATLVEHLNNHPSVRVLVRQENLPNAELINWRRHVERYGTDFFTSTMAWMMADAIDVQDVEAIGLWGIDCTGLEEYQMQRPGLKFFIREARLAGIEVVAPPESDILAPTPMYGLREFDNKYRKALARKQMYEKELATAQVQASGLSDKLAALHAHVDYLNYELRTWGSTPVENGNDPRRSGRED